MKLRDGRISQASVGVILHADGQPAATERPAIAWGQTIGRLLPIDPNKAVAK